MSAPGRFETKILALVVAVAVVPLLGALVLGQAALREVYQVGVNPRVRKELEKELSIYRQHFAALRQNAEQVADAISSDWQLRQAIIAGDRREIERVLELWIDKYRNLARVVVQNREGKTVAKAERRERLDVNTMKLVELKRAMPQFPKPTGILVTVAAPDTAFQEYARAGEIVEVYSRLEASGSYVSKGFLAVYLGFLLSVAAVAVVFGAMLSRRVSRRIVQLAEATERVGSGDLSVEVSSDETDEVGELARAFNDMVRDLRESRGRIEYLQRISAWQEFARRLAHEIKNPLTPIQLAVQEIYRTYPGGDERYGKKLSEAMAIVEEEIATLRRLVGEFSAFARLPQATLAPADLNEFVRDATRSVEIEEASPDETIPTEIRLELSTEPIMVRIDPMMLKRCLDNLIRNSRQAIGSATDMDGDSRNEESIVARQPLMVSFTEDSVTFKDIGKNSSHDGSRKRGIIRIRTRVEQQWALLEVDDNGNGIFPSDRNLVFDPYFTTKKEGTGLGLAIVKKVVLEHEGNIECTDSDLGGVSFRIRLPI
jgi:two-component system, NtrC family, nitrogen regulation sensor histidine kinase NtrY